MSENFDTGLETLPQVFMSILFVPMFWKISTYTKSPGLKSSENICIKETYIQRLAFDPGLALSGFQTTQPISTTN